MICRSCKSKKIHIIVDLGHTPPSNAFLNKRDLRNNEIFYPLKIFVCSNCWLVQTLNVLDNKSLFNNNYPYLSSYSDTLLSHVQDYTNKIIKRFKFNNSNSFLEIASNDGYLQDRFAASGLELLGIEPTSLAANIAKSKGHKVIKKFFGLEYSKDLVKKKGKFDLIIANNVFAHVPDINDFMLGIKVCLSKNGVVTIENPSVINLVEKNQFDTIYHEHFSYLSLTSVEFIAKNNMLDVFDVEESFIHGGSIRYYLQHKNTQRYKKSERVTKLKEFEFSKGSKDIKTYAGFRENCKKIKVDFLKFLYLKISKGKKFAAYGAAAKGNTFLNYCGLKEDIIQFIVDRNPKKIGLYAPGSHIPIVDEDYLIKMKPDYVIILPWNLKREIKDQLKYVRNWKAKFICAIPRLEIF